MTTTPNQEDPDEGNQKETNPIDLSELQNLNLGPNWKESSGPARGTSSKRDSSGSGRAKQSATQRDRRPSRPPRGFPGGGSRSPEQREKSGTPYGGDRRRANRTHPEPQPFKPTVEVSFFPDDTPFKVLTKAMRTKCRTYELFDIARLILDKNERFVVVIRPWGGSGSGDAVQTHLFISVPDKMPFESQEEAIDHVMSHCLDTFFELEEAEVDPPSGNFPMVNRCTITGELLGPPNYHRYQEFLLEHFSKRISKMSMERYQQKIETIRDEAVVAEWLEKMKKVTRYRLKAAKEGTEEIIFESADAARRYLLTHRKKEVVMEVDTVRLEGKLLDILPPGNIRRSIETCLEQQRRFPLDTANHLRGRLRRLKFHIYKKGSKGVSYICAVRRKFRDPAIPLADSADKLIRFIEANPNVPAPELPARYLGLEELPEEAGGEEPSKKKASGLRYPETPELHRLNQDLHWLIAEGYVTEYADGRLSAPPPLETHERGTKLEAKSQAETEAETETAKKVEASASEPEEGDPSEAELSEVPLDSSKREPEA